MSKNTCIEYNIEIKKIKVKRNILEKKENISTWISAELFVP